MGRISKQSLACSNAACGHHGIRDHSNIAQYGFSKGRWYAIRTLPEAQEARFCWLTVGLVADSEMNSRVHPKYKARYRATNWAEYDHALVKRGSITLWMTRDAIKWWNAEPTGHCGAPRKCSDIAIETALTLRLVLHLPLRQTEGFLRSVLELMNLSLEAPDPATLSRRGSALKVNLGVLQSKKPIHLIIDSSGVSIVGEGEWAAAKGDGGGRRGWRKLHLGVDASGSTQTQVLTKSNVDDVTTGIKIIKTTKGQLARVTADPAYDAVGFYDAAGARGALRRVVRHRGARGGPRDRSEWVGSCSPYCLGPAWRTRFTLDDSPARVLALCGCA
jgi:hypothetical protein